jgi:hypothetical protein
MVTDVFAVTVVVVIVNDGETDAPAATVTDGGTVALGSLLARVTTAPPAGAGPFSATVFAVVDAPPSTDMGDRVIELTVAFAEGRVVAETVPDWLETLPDAS